MAAALSDSALNLAVFRIAVFAVLLGSVEVYEAPKYAELAASLRRAPVGLGWLASALPISKSLVTCVTALLVVSSVLAMIGLWTRMAATVAAFSALYVLGVPQLTGTVIHNHHLVWFAALLAASPCADALSIDRW